MPRTIVRTIPVLVAAGLATAAIWAAKTAGSDRAGSHISVCGLRLASPRAGEPRFAVPSGGRATSRSVADRIVLCTLLRGDGSAFAQAHVDRLRHVLDMRFLRPSGRLLVASDAAFPAFPREHGAQVSCGSAAHRSTGHSYWQQTIRWRLGRAPSNLRRADVVRALRAAQSEWTNNVNWCGYPDVAEDFALYLGSTTSGAAHDGMNTVSWGRIDNTQDCNGALACTTTWYDAGGTPVESDVTFNALLQWTVRPGGRSFDVQSVAAHEFGHVRQFDHVTSERLRQYTLVMWPYFTRGDTSARKLGRGDAIADNLHY